MFKKVRCNDSTLNNTVHTALFIQNRSEYFSTGTVIYNVTTDIKRKFERYCGNISLSHISLNIQNFTSNYRKSFLY